MNERSFSGKNERKQTRIGNRPSVHLVDEIILDGGLLLALVKELASGAPRVLSSGQDGQQACEEELGHDSISADERRA